MLRARVPIAAVVLALAASGCATKQRVALDCVPRDVTVYVDGRAVATGTQSVELSRDRAHTVYFKGGGYEPRMVVLESVDSGLSPPDVCSHTAFVPVRPKVQMQLEDGS